MLGFKIIRSMTLGMGLFLLNCFSFAEDMGKVGDIKVSVLSEVEFQKIHGEEWVLMDGRKELSESNALRKQTGWTKVPDARGRYLRNADDRKVGNLISEGQVDIGTPLDFLTARPKGDELFKTDEKGIHNHSGKTGDGGEHTPQIQEEGGEHQHRIQTHHGGGLGAGGTAGLQWGTTDLDGKHTHLLKKIPHHDHPISGDGGHPHNIVAGGNKETRPYSIVVNFFMKISESKDCIKEIDSSEKINSRFSCLKSNIERWQNGNLSLSEVEISSIIRDLVYLRTSSGGNLLNDTQKEYIQQLKDNYFQYILLNEP